MLSFNHILTAVEQLLSERFPGVAVYRNLVEEDFDRPSFLIELGKVTMEDAASAMLELEVPVKVTVFVKVDDYHNSQVEDLMAHMAAVQELFAVEGLRVNDRVLHVGVVEGEYNYDYAEITVPLRYMDDRPGGRDWPLMREIETKIEEG